MASPGLFDPLGMGAVSPRTTGARPIRALAPALLVACAAATLVGLAWLRDDGDRGQPRAVVPITYARPSAPAAAQPAAVPPVKPVPPAEASPADKPAAPAVGAGVQVIPAVRAAAEAPRADGEAAPFFTSEDRDVEIQNGVRVIRPRRDRASGDGRALQPRDGAGSRGGSVPHE